MKSSSNTMLVAQFSAKQTVPMVGDSGNFPEWDVSMTDISLDRLEETKVENCVRFAWEFVPKVELAIIPVEELCEWWEDMEAWQLELDVLHAEMLKWQLEERDEQHNDEYYRMLMQRDLDMLAAEAEELLPEGDDAGEDN